MATPKKTPTKRKSRAKKAPAKRGPKEKEINYDEVLRLAAIQCTEEEIAHVLDYTPDGFRRRKLRDPELVGALQKGREKGRASLRRVQWEAAQAGDRTMMVWLGKQYLGQRDKQEVENTGPINVEIVKPK